MLRVLESQAPPRQYASETIDTFSGRLVSATLLEDRRQAIQGLRSFAKQYPASVASGGLKALIESLTRDLDDVDTGKIVLETLLFLFNPDEDSPEADDDIALLVADQFTQRQDNVTALLDLLENHDYYSRLYALQLLSAINGARPERMQDCVQSAPLGIPRLVAILDDNREAIRTTGLDLLNDITEASLELQKIVAFQDAFARIFAIIEAEGSLAEGGIVVQDCLNLLANLLRLNPSNQTIFREEGFVPRLAGLFQEDPPSEEDSDFEGTAASTNKQKNIWGILAVLRMFLVRGSIGTQANQYAFFRHHLLEVVLQLAFDSTLAPRIRAEALRTTADMVRNNAELQERFGGMQVPSPHASSSAQPNGNSKVNGAPSRSRTPDPRRSGSRPPSRQPPKQVPMVYVIEALLDLALSTHTISLFDVRYAAVEVISAYIENHAQIRAHFLARAIDGHKSGADETGNIITVLLGGPDAYQSSDPYRLWFAAAIALRLVLDDDAGKETLRNVAEGDEEAGEEVVTAVQIFTGHLISSFSAGLDERVRVAYLSLLTCFLFEDAAAINDLLAEGSTLQSLVTLAARSSKSRELSQGLAAVLLGIVYEFSTKDSPIPRTKLQPLLTSGLGREQYLQRLSTLRQQPALRDFEVIPQTLASATLPGTLPEVYLSEPAVAFIKDNYSRLTRALDKDPKKEILLHSESGVDRDVVDELRGEISSLKTELTDFKTSHDDAVLERDRKINASAGDLRKAQEEAERIKRLNEGLHRGHEEEVRGLEAKHKAASDRLKADHARALQDAQSKAGADAHTANRKLQDTEASHARRVQELERTVQVSERTVKGHEDTMNRLKQQLSDAQRARKESEEESGKRGRRVMDMENEKAVLQESLDLANTNVKKLEGQAVEHEKSLKEARNNVNEIKKELSEVREEASTAAQQVKELQSKQKSSEDKVSNASKGMSEKIAKLEKEVKEKEEARKSAQSELDDLFVMLSDLEEKRDAYRKKLKELGAEVTDAEDEDEDEEDEADEDEDEGEEEVDEEAEEADNTQDEKDEEGSSADADDSKSEANSEKKQTKTSSDADDEEEDEAKKPGHERESSID